MKTDAHLPYNRADSTPAEHTKVYLMMLWTVALLKMPMRVILGVGDTLSIPALYGGEEVEPRCTLLKGKSVKVLQKNRVVALRKGRSLLLCRYKGEKKAVIAVVRELKEGGRVIRMKVGERTPLPDVERGEGEEVKWSVRPPWLARVVGDSIEALSEGVGVLQVHVVKGNVVIREFPIRLVVIGDSEGLKLVPRFARVKVGDAIKLRVLGEYEGVEWIVLREKVGKVREDGTFVALRPGKTVVIARVKRGGGYVSLKALILVREKGRRKGRR